MYIQFQKRRRNKCSNANQFRSVLVRNFEFSHFCDKIHWAIPRKCMVLYVYEIVSLLMVWVNRLHVRKYSLHFHWKWYVFMCICVYLYKRYSNTRLAYIHTQPLPYPNEDTQIQNTHIQTCTPVTSYTDQLLSNDTYHTSIEISLTKRSDGVLKIQPNSKHIRIPHSQCITV